MANDYDVKTMTNKELADYIRKHRGIIRRRELRISELRMDLSNAYFFAREAEIERNARKKRIADQRRANREI